MKKILTILSVLVILLGFSSCQNAKEKALKSDVEATNAQCPIDMGIAGAMTAVKYNADTKTVHMFFSSTEEAMSINEMEANPELIKQMTMLNLTDANCEPFINMMADADAALDLTYKSQRNGKTFTLKLSADEIKEIKDNPLSEEETNSIRLASQLALENSRCPYPLDEGMEMVKAYDDGDYVVYYCTLDEDMYDMSLFESLQDQFKQEMKGIVNDPAVKGEVGIIMANGKGLTYRFHGTTTGQDADISFSNAELADML